MVKSTSHTLWSNSLRLLSGSAHWGRKILHIGVDFRSVLSHAQHAELLESGGFGDKPGIEQHLLEKTSSNVISESS